VEASPHSEPMCPSARNNSCSFRKGDEHCNFQLLQSEGINFSGVRFLNTIRFDVVLRHCGAILESYTWIPEELTLPRVYTWIPEEPTLPRVSAATRATAACFRSLPARLFPSAETSCGKRVRLVHFLQATRLPASRRRAMLQTFCNHSASKLKRKTMFQLE
jgi:hypothetical protein